MLGDPGAVKPELLAIGEKVQELAIDVALGPAFQTSGRVYADAHGALIRVRADHLATEERAAHSIHPCLLDACLHAPAFVRRELTAARHGDAALGARTAALLAGGRTGHRDCCLLAGEGFLQRHCQIVT